MRAFTRMLVAIAMVLLLGLPGPAAAQSSSPEGLLTADDVIEVFEGLWEGGCSTFGDTSTCNYQETGTEGLVSLVVRLPLLGSGDPQTIESWRKALEVVTPGATVTAEPVPGVGDAAAAMIDAAGVIASLEFYVGGATGSLVANTGRTVTVDDVSDLANRAIARIDPSLLAPDASGQPVPSATVLTTPALTGLPLADAQATTTGLGLRLEVRYDETSDQPAGTVTFQDPGAGTAIEPGGVVEVVVSAAAGTPPPVASQPPVADTVLTPGFIGYDLEGATALARAFGVNLSARRADGSQMSIRDVVQSQDPAANVSIPVGSTVSVVVAPAGAPVPSPTPAPTPAPTPTPTPSPVVGPVQAPGPSDISLDPAVVATSVVAAAGIVLLIPFPSALFNSTLEQNYAEIRGWFRFRRRRRTEDADDADPDRSGPDEPPDGGPSGEGAAPSAGAAATAGAAASAAAAASTGTLDRFWATPVGAVAFFAVAGLLYGFLDPDFGFSLDSVLLYVGILGALAAGTLVSNAALRGARTRLNAERGSFRVLPATLLVALVCVLVTRITDFQPGYLYGVLAGLVFATAIGRRETGREHAITSSAVAGVGVLAFLVLGVVRALEGSGGPTGAWIAIDVLLSALVIGGFEGLLFGMLPLTGLPGAAVKAWDARVWALLLFLGTLGFLHIIVNPSSGYLVDTSRTPLLKALALLIGFGLVSVGLWAWFRYRPMDRWRERQAQRASAGTAAAPAAAEASTSAPTPGEADTGTGANATADVVDVASEDDKT